MYFQEIENIYSQSYADLVIGEVVECDMHPKNGLKRRLTTKKRKKQTVHPFREHGLLAVRHGIFAGKNDPVRRAKAVRINETVCA